MSDARRRCRRLLARRRTPTTAWASWPRWRRATRGGMVDLSVGTPCDPPPPAVRRRPGGVGGRARLSDLGREPGRCGEAAAGWLARRFGVGLDPAQLAAVRRAPRSSSPRRPGSCGCARPERDTVLAPAIAYPTYAMGAQLAGCRTVLVPAAARREPGPRRGRPPPTPARAVVLWVNSPANPTGALDDLAAAAAFGRAHGVPVVSDECYAEFTWDAVAATDDPPRRQPTACWPCTRCRSAPTWPGCASAATRATPALVAVPVRGAQARRAHGGRAGPGRGRGGLGRRRARRARSGRVTGRRLERLAGVARGTPGSRPRLPAGGFYLWVPVPALGRRRRARSRAGAAPGCWPRRWPRRPGPS